MMSLAGIGRVSSLYAANISSISLSWHPPNSSAINNLSSVINGTGVYGFIFNSSATPEGVPYGTYNWCNMPHVRAADYPKAPSDYKLEYVEVVDNTLVRTSRPPLTCWRSTVITSEPHMRQTPSHTRHIPGTVMTKPSFTTVYPTPMAPPHQLIGTSTLHPPIHLVPVALMGPVNFRRSRAVALTTPASTARTSLAFTATCYTSSPPRQTPRR